MECRKTVIVSSSLPRPQSIPQWPNPFFFSSHVTRIWRFHAHTFVILINKISSLYIDSTTEELFIVFLVLIWSRCPYYQVLPAFFIGIYFQSIEFWINFDLKTVNLKMMFCKYWTLILRSTFLQILIRNIWSTNSNY